MGTSTRISPISSIANRGCAIKNSVVLSVILVKSKSYLPYFIHSIIRFSNNSQLNPIPIPTQPTNHLTQSIHPNLPRIPSQAYASHANDQSKIAIVRRHWPIHCVSLVNNIELTSGHSLSPRCAFVWPYRRRNGVEMLSSGLAAHSQWEKKNKIKISESADAPGTGQFFGQKMKRLCIQ